MASLHKPFLVAEAALKRLEDAAWLSLTERLQGSMTGQQHSSGTRPGHDPRHCPFATLVFHSRAPWHFPGRPGSLCLVPCTLPLPTQWHLPPSVITRNQSFPAMSASPEHLIMLRDTHLYHSWDQRNSNKFWEYHPLEGLPWLRISKDGKKRFHLSGEVRQ